MSDQYLWFIWASAFLLPWAGLYIGYPAHRRVMLWASLFTTPFGLTEPLFVPEYWNPPSLFDLAQKTGFDIESLIFCFAIGGVGAVFYNVLTQSKVQSIQTGELKNLLHRHHRKALLSPFVVFVLLVFLPWNPIYPGIIAMFVGALATTLCRPDLKKKTWIGGLLFLGYYIVFLKGLDWSSPGYIERVWNLDVLTGIMIFEMPIEELFFAFGFGMYWSGVYEHFTWKTLEPNSIGARPDISGSKVFGGRK